MKRERIPKQLYLSGELKEAAELQKEFGGSLLKKSHAKKARPISIKKAMHVTLKATKARGTWSLLASRNRVLSIESTIHKNARKFDVRIYKYANVGNHLHLLVKAESRKKFISFLRAISGIIARIVLGAQRGQVKLNESTQFWDQRPWTRVLAWKNDFYHVKKYVQQNFDEAMGFIPYKPRGKVLSSA